MPRPKQAPRWTVADPCSCLPPRLTRAVALRPPGLYESMLSRSKAMLEGREAMPSGLGAVADGKLTNGLVLAAADVITALAKPDCPGFKLPISKNKAVDYLVCDALGWPFRPCAKDAETAGKSVFTKAKTLADDEARTRRWTTSHANALADDDFGGCITMLEYGFNATEAFDAVSGLGTPKFAALLKAALAAA